MIKYFCDMCTGLLKDKNLYEGKPHLKIMFESKKTEPIFQSKVLCQECYENLFKKFKK